MPLRPIRDRSSASATSTSSGMAGRRNTACALCATATGPWELAAYAKAMGRFKPGPVDKVAEVIVRAIEARHPKRRYAVAEARTLGGVLPKLPAGLRDRVLATAVGLNGIKP